MNLTKKTIILTGAAGGFGQELTHQFCEKGANIIALDINFSSLQTLKQELKKSGHKIQIYRCDVTKKEDFEKIKTRLKNLKIKPDIWINNAGISFPKSFDDLPESIFEKIIKVNLEGVIIGTRTATQLMNHNSTGLIVNIASLSGHIPSPFLSPYTTAKHGVVGFTRGLQLEWEELGSPIKLMLVSPGFADTEIMYTNMEEFSFPDWLGWLVSSPESVAREIIKGIEEDKAEIYPSLSGPLLLKLYKYAPKFIFKMAARLLNAKNIKQIVGIENIKP